MLGNLLSFAGSLFGGSKSRSAAKSQQAVQVQQAQVDRELQKEFAQKGVQWRVEDAKKAGLHPLYAIGAQGASYSPTAFIPGQSQSGSWARDAGQALGRAADKFLARPDAHERQQQRYERRLGQMEAEARIRKLNAEAGVASRSVDPGRGPDYGPHPTQVESRTHSPAEQAVTLPTGEVVSVLSRDYDEAAQIDLVVEYMKMYGRQWYRNLRAMFGDKEAAKAAGVYRKNYRSARKPLTIRIRKARGGEQ